MVLGFLLTVLVIILTPRGEILRGAPDRGRLSVVLYVFHFLIIAPKQGLFNYCQTHIVLNEVDVNVVQASNLALDLKSDLVNGNVHKKIHIRWCWS